MREKKERKKQNSIDIRPIISLLIALAFFTFIIVITMLEVSNHNKPTGKSVKSQKELNQQGESKYDNYDSVIIGVVKEIDLKNKKITLFDIDQKVSSIHYYSGGSNVIDKFGQVISVSQIPIGTMVDVDYQRDSGKIIKLQISTKAWEYVGVNNLTIDRTSQIMKIANTNYKYMDDLIVLDGDSFVRVHNLAEQDELTIRGYKEIIWSITVTRGHGTVRLEDCEAFLGGNVTVGYEAIQKITDNLSITVREGNFNLTVENGKYSATKNITIYRNQETVVSLGDLGPEAEKMSRIVFEISPFGADLLIDGKLTSYANPIDLPYGEHTIEISLGGYTSYKGKLKLDEAGKIIKIDLPELNSRENVTVSIEEEQLPNGINPTEEISTENNANPWSGGRNGEEYIIDENHIIFVQKPIGASVYFNGEFVGTSPVSFEKIIGTHVLTFIKQGHETQSYTVEVVDDGLDTYFSLPNLIKID